jgi:hypothetical protein
MFLKIISDEIWDVESGLKEGIMIGNSEVGSEAFRLNRLSLENPAPTTLL